MLQMIHGNEKGIEKKKLEKDAMRFLGEVDTLSPFDSVLEYNSPAHGTWNIVHIGMLIPDSHQIYVCADNCNRGVILTAAEMNAISRFSTIAIREEDLFNGGMEDLIIEGVSDILRGLPQKPSAVLLFTVCVHHFMGTDIPYIYETLRARFPDQFFVECYMDPIMQKGGLTPDQKLRKSMYDCLKVTCREEKQINIYGSNLSLPEESELKELIRRAGFTYRDLTECRTFEEFLTMGNSSLNVVNYPLACYGGEELSKRLGMDYLYLPLSFDFEKIKKELDELAGVLGTNPLPHEVRKDKCLLKLKEAKAVIGDTEIGIDANATPAFLSLAKLLVSAGFRVTHLFADALPKEEEEAFLWLKERKPEIRLYATIHPNMRMMPRQETKSLAIGQKAAYFMNTKHFVNMAEGGGLFGYDGICRITDRMIEAYRTEKDPKEYISKKGWGCACCL